MQLDDVHCSHGQASSIHHAANIAIKANVVQIILTGSNLPVRMICRADNQAQLCVW